MPKEPRGEKRPADAVGAAVMVALLDAREAPPAKRGPYKPRAPKAA